jgi:hypothetical protein
VPPLVITMSISGSAIQAELHLDRAHRPSPTPRRNSMSRPGYPMGERTPDVSFGRPCACRTRSAMAMLTGNEHASS